VGLLATKDPTFDEKGQRIPHRGSRQRNHIAAPDNALALDLARGRTDIRFFAKRFLAIELHPGQLRFAVAAAMRAPNGYSPAFLDLALCSGNRAGKTLLIAVVILHHTFYKLGIKPADPLDPRDIDRWSRQPYNWYHLSYEGKVANIVFNDLRAILVGSHRAQQGRGCPLVDELGPVVEWDKKELGEYPWIKVHPSFGAGEIHFRHTNEKGKALLGLDMNGESYDEAAFEIYLQEIRDEVLHFRRLATGGPIFWIGTGTEGYNAFADFWELGNPDDPNRHPRRLSMRMSTRDNVGYGITQEDFDDLVATTDERLIPQNIDGYFIEAVDAYFNAGSIEAMFVTHCLRCDGTGVILPLEIDGHVIRRTSGDITTCPSCRGSKEVQEEYPPQKAHRYVQGVDPGISHDATWAMVLDYTAPVLTGVRVVKRGGRQALPVVINMVREGHMLYSADGAFATTIIDETGMGGKMYRQEFALIRPLRTFDFAGTKAKKLNLLANLKAVIDKGGIKLPKKGSYWPIVRRQLLGYKLDDRKIEQDAVMTLAMAVHHATRNPTAGLASPTFDYYGD
jgi:hypothetical protein